MLRLVASGHMSVCVPPVCSRGQLVRLLMFNRVRDQSIKMGQLVELFKRGEKNKVYCDSITLVPIMDLSGTVSRYKITLSMESVAPPDIEKVEVQHSRLFWRGCFLIESLRRSTLAVLNRGIKTLFLLLFLFLLLGFFFGLCNGAMLPFWPALYWKIDFDIKRPAWLNGGHVEIKETSHFEDALRFPWHFSQSQVSVARLLNSWKEMEEKCVFVPLSWFEAFVEWKYIYLCQ